MSEVPSPPLANRLLLAYQGALAAAPLLGYLPVFLVANFYGLLFALNFFQDFPYLPDPLVLDLQYVWGTVVASAAFLAFLARRYLPRHRKALGLFPSSLREALALSFIVLAYELGLWAFSYWLFPSDPFPSLSSEIAATPPGWIGYAVFAVLLAPVMEEILFRGYLLRAHAAARGPRFALYGEAILFALFHLHPLRMLRSFGFAWILGRAVLARGSLVPAVAAHMATNALGFAMIHLAPNIPPPSPAVGIGAGIVALLAIGVTAWRFPLRRRPLLRRARY